MTRSPRTHTRDRILQQLRRREATVDELVAELGLSRGAVRLQLTSLEREGFVARRGTQKGATKPAISYEITARGQVSLSRGYVPMLTHLLHVLSSRLRKPELDEIMHEVGRLMIRGRAYPSGPLDARVEQASALFNELGGLTAVDRLDTEFVIRSHGCPFAASTERNPAACSAVEVLFSEFIGAAVQTCCDRDSRQRCCFSVSMVPAAPAGP